MDLTVRPPFIKESNTNVANRTPKIKYFSKGNCLFSSDWICFILSSLSAPSISFSSSKISSSSSSSSSCSVIQLFFSPEFSIVMRLLSSFQCWYSARSPLARSYASCSFIRDSALQDQLAFQPIFASASIKRTANSISKPISGKIFFKQVPIKVPTKSMGIMRILRL